MLNEPLRGRCGEQSSRSKACHGQAGNKSAAVGKPFHQHRDRNHVTHSEADATDHAIRQIKPPELVRGKTGQKNAASPEKPGDHGHGARLHALHHAPAHEGEAAQEKPADRKMSR